MVNQSDQDILEMNNKNKLLKEYIDYYTPENRLDFCKLSLSKHKFENYSIKTSDIQQDDYIIQNNDIKNQLKYIINKNICSIDDFSKVFSMMTIDDINYIGF
jgi:hypothetical protein